MRLPTRTLPLLLCLLLFAIPVEPRKKCRKRKNQKKCERKEALRLGESTSRTLDEGPDDIVRVERKPKQSPKWRKQAPKDTLLIQREGSEAVFKCKASGRPRPKVKWIKDGEPIRVKKNKKYNKSKWKLQVDKVTPGDNGNYTCLIENSVGQLEWTFTLRVLENQPISEINIVERPQNQTAHVGDTVVFMCRSNTWPAPLVHWSKKTADKLVVQIVQMENNTLAEVLVVHNVSKADAGEYTCYIGNDLSNLRLSATLTVIEEGESLPFEPRCALHIRRQILVDNTYGCQTTDPVEINYCMGSCGRSYFIPTMLTTDDTDMQANHLNQTCQCCMGVVSGIRIVPLKCPFGDARRGFFTLLSDCRCQSCSMEKSFLRGQTEDTVTLAP
ncbi:fibroblast growth factor receptor 4-like isoform X2 [Littorina saxatilis]|uniref:fibroblast growth factor receptor 4-like isoform X2 n=1 Tax=Littorina saxatilis TaxID=31220 RepID=UPI0038B6ADFE